MSSPFQNRLVGTIIVAAIAIIFLPDLLDGNKKTHQAEFDNIPKAPRIQALNTNKQFPDKSFTTSQIINADESDEPAQDELLTFQDEPTEAAVELASTNHDSSDVVKVTTLTIEPPISLLSSAEENIADNKSTTLQTLPEKSVPKEAWVIQLGSFRHESNVEQLVNKLTKNGYTSYTKPIKTKNGTLTKVFIGPELIRSSLEKKLPALKQLTNIEGKIARFYPTK